MTPAAELASGIDALGLDVDKHRQEKLLAYLELLVKWNRVYNLTAIREPERMVSQHLLDSLAVLPHIYGHSIADVGAGAGLPGIPLAIVRDDWRVTLVESNHKKSAFLKQCAIELALSNVTIAEARVEVVEPRNCYDVVIARAFSDLAELAALAGTLCTGAGVLAAMKGVYPYEEIAALPAHYRVERVVPLKVPGLEAERHLVLMRLGNP